MFHIRSGFKLRSYLTDRKTSSGHKHLLIFLTGVRMVQMLMKPSAQNISHGLGQVSPTAFTFGINRVSHNSEIGLLRMRHHRLRHLLLLGGISHWVPIRRLAMHHGCVLFVSAVYHLCGHGSGLTTVFVRIGIGAWRHPAVWVTLSVWHGSQVSYRGKDRTGSSCGGFEPHRQVVSHLPGRVFAGASSVFVVVLSVGRFR